MTAGHGRAALVTGCSSGIGAATALALRTAGFVVYATARDVSSLEGLAAQGCRTRRLDVTDEESMRAAVAAVEQAHGAVDVLVNNAGYADYGALEAVSVARWRLQLDTNVVGAVCMMQLVLPGMRARGHGRIVNVSSMGGRMTLPIGAAYHASKYALEALSDVARLEVGAFGVDVAIVEPGIVRTNFPSTAAAALASDQGPHAPLAAAFGDALDRAYRGLPLITTSTEAVAARIVHAATARRPRTRYRVGLPAYALPGLRRLLPDRGWDAALRWALAPDRAGTAKAGPRAALRRLRARVGG